MYIVTEVLVPFVSAIIGGGLTLMGVCISLNSQNKKDEKAKKAEAKPWLFNCDEDYWRKTSQLEYLFQNENTKSANSIYGFIKNTDNATAILEKITTEFKEYTPSCGAIIDKGESACVIFDPIEGESLRQMVLHIKDIYGNDYQYDMNFHGSDFTIKERG